MTIKSATEADRLVSSQDVMTKKLKNIVLVVPAVGLLIGTAGMMLDPRLGLLGTAFLFGWTQLVGL